MSTLRGLATHAAVAVLFCSSSVYGGDYGDSISHRSVSLSALARKAITANLLTKPILEVTRRSPESVSSGNIRTGKLGIGVYGFSAVDLENAPLSIEVPDEDGSEKDQSPPVGLIGTLMPRYGSMAEDLRHVCYNPPFDGGAFYDTHAGMDHTFSTDTILEYRWRMPVLGKWTDYWTLAFPSIIFSGPGSDRSFIPTGVSLLLVCRLPF